MKTSSFGAKVAGYMLDSGYMIDQHLREERAKCEARICRLRFGCHMSWSGDYYREFYLRGLEE